MSFALAIPRNPLRRCTSIMNIPRGRLNLMYIMETGMMSPVMSLEATAAMALYTVANPRNRKTTM